MHAEDIGPTAGLSGARRALLDQLVRGKLAAASAIPRRPPGAPAPASFAQERLWFLDQLEPGKATYNVFSVVRLDGALHPEALGQALGEVVRRHETLRTTFAPADGAPLQVVHPPGPFPLPVRDLGALPGPARERLARRLAREEALRPFDLAADRPFRAVLLRLHARDHVLVVSMHHIVGDGWSTGVLFGELAALHAAFGRGEPSPLAELPVQFADYALWQREQLRGEALETQAARWRERLAGAPALLELPTDHPRPPAQSHRGGAHPLELSAAPAEALRALARGERASLFMVMLAAWQVLLGRYAGQDDVVVGTPIAGRTHPSLEGLIGFFANTLALRGDLSGDPPFTELLRRVRATTLDAYQDQELPLERLVAELHPERTLSHHPVFQVMLSLQSTPPAPITLSGVRAEPCRVETASAKYDLLLALGEDGPRVVGDLVYATDLFDPGTAARLARHFVVLLEAVAADPTRPLSALPLMDAAERDRLLSEWSLTDAPPPRECVHERFAAQAALAPDAVALVSGGEALTYAHLDARANRLARHLADAGVGSESRVGVALERGPELIVCLLGVLKAGGAYVPLDPASPPGRLALILADAAVEVLVTERSLAPRFGDAPGTTVVIVDRDAEEIAARPPTAPPPRAGAGSLAYVMYTSGSTGTPKGVGVEHRGILRLVRGADYAGLGPDEVILHAAPVSFDASTFEIWGALLNGGRLVLLPGGAADLGLVGGTLRRHGVTTLWLTAGLFDLMARERLDDLAGVRQLLAGGDVLPPGAARAVRGRLPALRLINGYGPTENTTFTCCHTLGERWEGGPVPVGRPVAGTHVYLLDAALRPVPAGVPGEVCAGGSGVARGYLGRPGPTAERFLPDPFRGEPGARMYRTGDRGRWRGDGTVEFLGRADRQVKIRGFRVEPGEVEAALAGHPGVRACAVVAREDAPGEKRLVAYWAGGGDAAVLRAHLAERLPEYMLPAAWVRVDALPLTPSGKVDRRALPAPAGAAEGATYAAPRTPVEEVLAAVWAEVLRVERVGVHDHFFHLGGHSLLATRAVSRIRAALGVELPLRALFEGPTVAEVAARVEELRRGGRAPLPPVLPAERGGPLPLSLAQERLWFLDRLEGGSPAYHIPGALRLRGPLDAPALERALGEVVRRHEALRTTFRESGGVAEQVVAPFGGFALPVSDLSPLGAEEREAEARRRAREHARAPFDLGTGPLFRAELLRLGEGEHLFLFCMHHVVSDGWSMRVFARDLSRLYDAAVRGEPSPLPPLAVQAADHAVWQRRHLRGAELERQTAYWRERLAGVPAYLSLPTDHPRAAARAHRGSAETRVIARGLADQLRAVGRNEGATPFMVLLAAFQLLLARHAGTDDVVVGTPIAGRTRAEVEELIGFFVNTLVLRTDLSGDPTFRQLLARVREVTLGAYDHQDLPFDRLVAELAPERDPSRSPLVQVMVNFLDPEGAAYALGEARAEAEPPAEPGYAKFDWNLYAAEHDGEIGLRLAYDASLFTAARAREVLRQLEALLAQAAADPGAPVSRLSLSADAPGGLLPDPAAPLPSFTPAEGLSARLRRIAAEAPERAALRDAAGEWSYAQLDAAASAVAAALRAGGIGAGETVAILARRAASLAAAVLGVMRSGAAFALLDPDHPPARNAAILGQLEPRGWIRVLDDGGDGEGEGDGEHGGAAARGPVAEHFRRHPVPVSIGLPARPEAIVAALGPAAPEPAGDDPSPDAPAYVLFTSGTEGRPKGVVGTHRPLLHFLDWHARAFGLGAGDRFALLSGLSHDPVLRDLLAPLWVGATLCVPAPGRFLEPGWLRGWMAREGVTVAHLTPSLGRALLDMPGRADEGPLPLRLACFAGETLTRGDARRLRAAAPAAACVSFYGATETPQAMGVHAVEVDDADGDGGARDGEPVPVGRGIDGVQLLVLDARGALAGVGELGEIHVRTPHLTLGYPGDPALTAARFVPSPFRGAPGERLYRTGDLGRYLPDGSVAFAGRRDLQVKVRGFRVEPGEVEHALRAHPGVRAAAVDARGDAPGERRLAAYVVPAGEGGPSADELRRHLRERLPEAMVPGAFVFLDRLPLTPSGKVDRRALPDPGGAGAGGGAGTAPRSEAEATVAGIWAEVLGVDSVALEDDFFSLGGHSLLAMRVVARVWEALAVDLPLHVALFEAPTVAELARWVEAERSGRAPASPVAWERMRTQR